MLAIPVPRQNDQSNLCGTKSAFSCGHYGLVPCSIPVEVLFSCFGFNLMIARITMEIITSLICCFAFPSMQCLLMVGLPAKNLTYLIH
jgi:hypothetical protein